MSARSYRRARDGATVYVGCFYGPDGARIVRKVRVVKADAPKRDHERARIAAVKWAQDQRIDVENRVWVDPAPDRRAGLSVHGLIARFLRSYVSRSGRVDYYIARAKVLERLLPKKPADKLGVADVDAFRRAREEEGVSPSTVGHDLIALGTIYRWGIARSLVQSNPADSKLVRRPPRPHPDPRPYTEGEIVAILDQLPESFGAVVTFCLLTGADRSEAVNLTWSRHVDTDRQLLRLPRAKTGVDRTIPYGRNARLKLLLDTARRVRHPSGRVFLHNGAPVIGHSAESAMLRAMKRAGVKKPRPWKTLRATFATTKVMEGWDVPTVAALMGLTTAHVLEHYVKPSGVHLQNAMADAESMLNEQITTPGRNLAPARSAVGPVGRTEKTDGT